MKNYVVWLENSIRFGETMHSSFDYILAKEVSDNGDIFDTLMIPQDHNPIKNGMFNTGLACKSWKNALNNFNKQLRSKEPIRLVFFNSDQHRKFVDMNTKYGILNIENCVIIDRSKYYDESINYSNSSAENLYKVCQIIKTYGIEELQESAKHYKSRNNVGKNLGVGKLGRVAVNKDTKFMLTQVDMACQKLGFSWDIERDRLVVKTLVGDYSINIYNRPCEINENNNGTYRKILNDCYSPIDALVEIKELEKSKVKTFENKYREWRLF